MIQNGCPHILKSDAEFSAAQDPDIQPGDEVLILNVDQIGDVFKSFYNSEA